MSPSKPESCRDPFLIIAGVAKAGTTSQFKYLADHPAIAACSTKSPFYFLPPDFPSEPGPRYGEDPLSTYLELFPATADGRIRFEASPLYLLAPGAAERIARVLPRSRIVVSIRDPIARLASFHKMAVLFGWLPRALPFAAYVATALRDHAAGTPSPYYAMTLEDGRYAARLQHWMNQLGRDRVHVVLFEEFQADPARTMMKIARFADIDPDFYADYVFQNQNPGLEFRAGYAGLRQLVARAAPPGSALRRTLGGLRRRVEPLLLRLVTRPTRRRPLDPAADVALRRFYADDVAALPSVLGRPVPWAGRYGSGA